MSRRQSDTSTSSCSRRTPVKASIAHPPLIHQSRSYPCINSWASAGVDTFHGPYKRWNANSSGSSPSAYQGRSSI